MYCRQCFTLNPEDAAVCLACGAIMTTGNSPTVGGGSVSPVPGGTAQPSSGGDDQRWASNDSGNPYAAPLPSTIGPGATTPRPAVPAFGKPESYLVPAILVTFCCCLPFGIPAIVYAAQVDSKWSVGDPQGAQAASAEAKKWMMISLFVGLVVQLLPFLFYLFLIVVAIAAGV